ncbi:hypothetical protein MIND_01080000 [Mycena indigotica]|uniref:Uncharacterized protein n=1 Tax=Mycena indigotica TaxID=2126181 RepID=A0A8H6W0Y9_9AGAR|nr:uncharacterized protein MIND_01080000 [Mycena indigotica]KAF7295404.1 hypothetical protein MIND_01080000 [Mycena indigotica]
MYRRPRTRFPATLPFDQPPARVDQDDPRGVTPLYILAWRVPPRDLGLYPRQFSTVNPYYTKMWCEAREKEDMKQHISRPLVFNCIRDDEDSDVMYFVVDSNNKRRRIALDSLDMRLAKETLEEFYDPRDEPDAKLGNPLWYRVGSFDDHVPATT